MNESSAHGDRIIPSLFVRLYDPGMGRHGDHRSNDDVRIAKVAGIVAHHAENPPVDIALAVEEIHEVTTDPHLLGHAWLWPPRFPVFEDPWMEAKNEILGAAGADPQHPTRETLC